MCSRLAFYNFIGVSFFLIFNEKYVSVGLSSWHQNVYS